MRAARQPLTSDPMKLIASRPASAVAVACTFSAASRPGASLARTKAMPSATTNHATMPTATPAIVRTIYPLPVIPPRSSRLAAVGIVENSVSAALERRIALFDEGLGGFLVILGEAGVH